MSGAPIAQLAQGHRRGVADRRVGIREQREERRDRPVRPEGPQPAGRPGPDRPALVDEQIRERRDRARAEVAQRPGGDPRDRRRLIVARQGRRQGGDGARVAELTERRRGGAPGIVNLTRGE